MGLLERLHAAEGLADIVVLALVVEGLFAGPFLADDVQIFAGAGVTLILGQMIAILGQFRVRAAGDDMDRDAAAAEMIQGRELPRRQGRGREAGAVGDHEAELPGHAGRMAGDQDAFGGRGVEGDERAVEPARFMGAGHGLHMRDIQRRALGRAGLRRVVAADIANEFNGHRGVSFTLKGRSARYVN